SETYTLSLHDALPIWKQALQGRSRQLRHHIFLCYSFRLNPFTPFSLTNSVNSLRFPIFESFTFPIKNIFFTVSGIITILFISVEIKSVSTSSSDKVNVFLYVIFLFPTG